MDSMTKNSAFHPLVEKMFGYLDKKSLDNCRLVSKSWKTVSDDPLFWLKKIEIKYGRHDIKCWKKLIEKLNDPDIRSLMSLTLFNIYQTEEQDCICNESEEDCEKSGFIHPKSKSLQSKQNHAEYWLSFGSKNLKSDQLI